VFFDGKNQAKARPERAKSRIGRQALNLVTEGTGGGGTWRGLGDGGLVLMSHMRTIAFN